jgi:glucose-6-phosphate 1-dehydrogenase
MSFRYEASFGSELIEAYERLLHDAMIGDQLLFTSGRDIGRAWELVGPVLADPPPLHPYAKGSWGPPEADDLVGAGTWNAPGEARVT